MPYGGIKVLEIPIRIYSPTPAATGRPELWFDKTYGMAFAGSYTTAFLLKELIAEVLTHVQFLGPQESISFDKICEFVFRFHKHLHEKLKSHLETDYEIDFFLGGFCPVTRQIRVAKFWVDAIAGEPHYSEILTGSGPSFQTIGIESGRRRFEELINLSLTAPCRVHFAAFRRLWDVIRDPAIPFVTGVVQYGEFETESFQMIGALDVKLENGFLKSRTFVRGTDVEEITECHQPESLQIGYTYGNLFDEDIRSFDTTNDFWEPNGTRRTIDEQITLFPHNPEWTQWYEEERDFLSSGLCPCQNISVEHIGSTAVAGLAALPIIDILVGIDSPGGEQVQPFNLAKRGYEYLRDTFIIGNQYYRKRGTRAFNLHVVERNGSFWRRAIRVRDYLRENPEETAFYSKEKMRVLNLGSWTLLRYLNAKANYLEQLTIRASQSSSTA